MEGLEKQLELRMYFFVPYNISPIQQAIQAGHAALEYAHKYGDTEVFKNFVVHHKTWIILNGGTTNANRDFEGISQGTLNQIGDQLLDNQIDVAWFHEPDLNDALTALCFICDERVFNRKDYPDFVNWLLDVKMYESAKEEAKKNNPELWVKLRLYPEMQQEMFPEYYKEWVRFLGGLKNVFLRNLIEDKKLA
jgi:hypothetical protein